MSLSKAARTKEAILEEAMVQFNTKGYAGTHIRDLAKALQMTQGAIYGNFKNKDELAKESFRKAYMKVGTLLWHYINETTDPTERLRRSATFYTNYLSDPIIAGGCPMLNTAVEADDHYEVLQEEVKRAFGKFEKMMRREITQGQEAGQFKAELDLDYLLSVMTAVIEGSILTAKACGDEQRLHHGVRFLLDFMDREIIR